MIQVPWWTKYAAGGALATGVLVIAARKAFATPALQDPWLLSPPLKSVYVTQGWWEPRTYRKGVHLGLDLRAAVGTPVYAPADGTISHIDTTANDAAGLNLIIAHPGGIATRYMHLNGFVPGLVVGSKVKRGQLIAYTGISSYGMQGVKSGPHLHFETTVDRELLSAFAARFGKPSTGYVGMGRKVFDRKMSYVPGESLIAGTYRQRAIDRAALYGFRMHPEAVVEGVASVGTTGHSALPWIAGALVVGAVGSGGWYVYTRNR